MNTTAQASARMSLPDLVDLGEFTLLLHDETIESGAQLAQHIRESIAVAFAKLDPLLSLVYELEIVETQVATSSRKSKNRVQLKRKKGATRQTLFAMVTWVTMAIGVLSADYSKIPENLEKACQMVVTDCNLHGRNVEIPEKHFIPVDPRRPA